MRERLGITLPPGKMWDQLFAELKRARPSVGHRVPTTCADLAAVGQGSEIGFDRRIPADVLPQLRLGPRPGREQPLAELDGERLKNNFSFMGHVRRLSAQSAGVFAELLAGSMDTCFKLHGDCRD